MRDTLAFELGYARGHLIICPASLAMCLQKDVFEKLSRCQEKDADVIPTHITSRLPVIHPNYTISSYLASN